MTTNYHLPYFDKDAVENTINLVFNDTFDDDIYLAHTKIASMTFGYRFNKVIYASSVPDTLHTLIFDEEYNQYTDELQKSHIKKIIFGKEFNKPVNMLPEYLDILKFGYDFNQSVSKLPKYLTVLKFGDNFNKRISNIPKTVSILKLCRSFDTNIYDVPKCINMLTIYFTETFYKIKMLNEKYILKNIDIKLFDKKFIKKIPYGTKYCCMLQKNKANKQNKNSSRKLLQNRTYELNKPVKRFPVMTTIIMIFLLIIRVTV